MIHDNMNNELNFVSVIIPNYNGLKYLKNCLNSLKNENKLFLEIIIVENGSNDGSAEYLNKLKDQSIKVIYNKKNLGFAKAVNQGINESNSEYVCLLNNDVEIANNFFSNLLNCIENDSKIFSVSSKMLQHDNRNLIDDAGDEYNLFAWSKKIANGKPSNTHNDSKEVFSSCAGAAMYRKAIFKEIGYFDENFFAYLEDIDISYRALINGYKNMYCPEAICYHVGSASSGSKHNEFKTSLSPRNNIWVVYKNMPWPQILINIGFLFFGFLIKQLYFYKKGLGRTYYNSLKEGIKGRKKVKKVKYKNKNLKNYLKIEWLLFKNLFKYPF